MKTQRAWRQVTVLALVAAMAGVVGAVTLVSASAQHNDIHDSTGTPPIGFPHLPAETSAEEQRPDDVDIVIVYDKSGSMEYDTLCYGCWEPSEEQYPNGNIYPLPWSDSTIESADHCGPQQEYLVPHGSITDTYIIVEAEEYSRLSVDYADWGYKPYYTVWVVQRNDKNYHHLYAGRTPGDVNAMGRDTRGAYLSHHPYIDYREESLSGLGVACTWEDLNNGEICRRGVPGGPFSAPRADYDFTVPRTGTYRIWIRGQGGSNGGNQHIFWGLDGSPIGEEGGFPAGAMYDGAVGSDWRWRRLGSATWPAGEIHTLHLWAGGAGFDVDRIIITTDSRGWDNDPPPPMDQNEGRGPSFWSNGHPNPDDWACNSCDPRFGGRPGGAMVCDDDDPPTCLYRPDCQAFANPDQRKHPIYDDEQPMRTALEAAKRFVGRLNPGSDQVGYVRYATDAQIASELQCQRRLGAGNCTPEVITDTVLYELDHTRAGGSTNIAGGIESGIDVLSTTAPHYGRPGAARVMVLMTDGQANKYPNDECWQEDLWPDVGDSTLDRASDCVMYYAQEARDNGIAICTISLGYSADRELMDAAAELTGCTNRGADSREELDAIFDELYERIFPRLIAEKAASTQTAVHGQIVTYTIAVQSPTGPLTATVHLTDEVPVGLSYVPGTLTATVGTVTDDDAPILHWSGVLSPTPAVTVTYGITVSATAPQVITNTAVIAARGYQTISRTATVTVVQAPGQPDLSPSYKAVSPQYADHGERVTYTIAIPKDCQQLLQAGSFEGNPDTVFGYWHAGEPLAYKHQSYYVYEGSMSMRLHASMGSYPECSAYHPYLWQAVTIPEEIYPTTTMVVQGQRLVAGSMAPCSIADSAEADDVLYLQMQDSGGGDLGDATEIVDGGVVTQTWEAFEVDVTDAVDLTNHAGQEVRVHFTATHDEDFADTWFYLDALECEVCTEWLIGLTDTVPDGLSYVSGTLTATAGTVTDVAAPTLRWSCVLSPTRDVTVTYAVTVSAIAPRVITNTAVITVPGYQAISRTATVWANPYRFFLPVVMRDSPGSARGTQ